MYGSPPHAFAPATSPATSTSTSIPSQIPAHPSQSPSSAPPPSGLAPHFSLTVTKDDSALFQDARIGFSHLLPGRPALSVPSFGPHEAPADVAIHLQDAPVVLRYRLEAPSFAAPTAQALAHATAARHAAFRAQPGMLRARDAGPASSNAVSVDHANATWLRAWSVEAAAVSAYDVAITPGAAVHEDLFVLVRHGAVLIVTWTYPRTFLDEPPYATFASVAEATMVWDPTRWEQYGKIWPESAFTHPGLAATPKPKHQEALRALGPLTLDAEARTRLLTVLSGIVSSAGAPWVKLSRELLDTHHRLLARSVRDPRFANFVEVAFGDVATAHDLRGLAILLGRSVGPRPSGSIPIAPTMPFSTMETTTTKAM